MDSRVGEEVGQHLAQSPLVPEDEDRSGSVERDRPVGVDRACVGHRVLGEDGDVDRLALERLALVESGEQEEVLDERAHPRALLVDALHRPVELLAVRRPPPR